MKDTMIEALRKPRFWVVGLAGVALLGMITVWMWPRSFVAEAFLPQRSLVVLRTSWSPGAAPPTFQTEWGRLLRNLAGPSLAWMDSLHTLDVPEGVSSISGALALLPGESYQLGWVAAFPDPGKALSPDGLFQQLGFHRGANSTRYQGIEMRAYNSEYAPSLYFARVRGAWLLASGSIQLESAVNAAQDPQVSLQHALSEKDLRTAPNGLLIHFPALDQFLTTFSKPRFHPDIASLKPFMPAMPMAAHYDTQRLSLIGGRAISDMPSMQPMAHPALSHDLMMGLPDQTAWAWIFPARNEADPAPADSTSWGRLRPLLQAYRGMSLGPSLETDPTQERLAFFPYAASNRDRLEQLLDTLSSRSLEREGQVLQLMARPIRLTSVFDALGAGSWRFAVLQDDLLVLACSPDPLLRFVRAREQERTLAQHPAFVRFREGFFSSSHWSLYARPEALSPYLRYFFDDAFDQRFQNQYRPLLEQLDLLMFQGVQEEGQFSAQLTLGAGQPDQNEPPLAVRWEYQLGSALQHAPAPVRNHERDRTEWLCFDADQRISMITPEGNHSWLRQLDGHCMGRVEEIDLYQNDKIQYLFNTPTQVYLLDRKGREVANYPTRLPDTSATALSAFPIGPDGRQQYFIGSGNQRVYGYDAGGEPLNDWNGLEVQGAPSVPFKYFSLRGQAYVFTSTEGGYFYLWKADGSLLREIDLGAVVRHPWTMHFAAKLDACTLFGVDTAARLIRVRLDGSSQTIPLQNPPRPARVQALDVTGNSRHEFLVADERRFGLYNQKGELRRGRYFREPVDPESVQLEPRGSQRFLLAYAAAHSERIFFEDYRSGDLVLGGTAAGRAPFYLGPGNDSRHVLLTGTDDGRLLLYDVRKPQSP